MPNQTNRTNHTNKTGQTKNKTEQTTQAKPRRLIDAETGFEVDQKTGLLIDPKTGLLIDPDRLEPGQEEAKEKIEEKLPPAASVFASIGLVLALISMVTLIVLVGVAKTDNTGLLIACSIGGVLSIVAAIIAGGVGKRFSEWRILVSLFVGIVATLFSAVTLVQIANTPAQTTTMETMPAVTTNDGTGASSSGSVVKPVDTNVPAAVVLGTFVIQTGTTKTTYYLPVTVTNADSKAHSYQIEIEAVKNNGTRIATDTIYINNLASNQTSEEKCFENIDSNLEDDFKQATFRVIKNESID